MSYLYKKLEYDDIINELMLEMDYDQASAIAEYYLREADTSVVPIEIDYHAIINEFSIYPSALEALSDRGSNVDYIDENQALLALQEQTLVLDSDTAIIVRNT